MKKQKIKIYRLCISDYFPKTHKRAGEPTGFADNIIAGIKKHTIRKSNVWVGRIDEVKAGNAVLLIFGWTEKPYRSKTYNIALFGHGTDQVREFCRNLIQQKRPLLVDVGDVEIGTQMIQFKDMCTNPEIYDSDILTSNYSVSEVAAGDGLSLEDFQEWFKDYDLSEPMTIIHLTKFRY